MWCVSVEGAGEVLSRTILKMGGKKTLGHKWQWRRAVILIEAKLRYWDAKVRRALKGEKERSCKRPTRVSLLSLSLSSFLFFLFSPDVPMHTRTHGGQPTNDTAFLSILLRSFFCPTFRPF